MSIPSDIYLYLSHRLVTACLRKTVRVQAHCLWASATLPSCSISALPSSCCISALLSPFLHVALHPIVKDRCFPPIKFASPPSNIIIMTASKLNFVTRPSTINQVILKHNQNDDRSTDFILSYCKFLISVLYLPPPSFSHCIHI